MAMFNLHRVFAEAPDGVDFLSELAVPDRQERRLRSARDAIRDKLKAGFGDWQAIASRRVVMDAAAIRNRVPDPKLRPKFRMQGSASPAYRTLNNPAHVPPQQIDYDDGVYLPVSFLAETKNPVLASAGYFHVVETALEPLCSERGWQLDKSKPSCVRIILDDQIHIDLPLYAIPDQEFEQLIETQSATKFALDRAMILDGTDLADSVYEAFDEDELRLAHRDKGWIISDPRLLERWFKDAIATHGPQVRRVCRYYKGWRDHQWNVCCLSSISLMKCVVDTFDELRGAFEDKRDDIAVLEVAARLERYFAGDIENPVLPGKLNDNWSAGDRAMFRQKAGELHRCLNEAIRGTDQAAAALACLTKAFGPRIPQDVGLVSLTAEATVRAFQPTKVPARQVPRTTSG
jgi:hypothetical protein